MPCVAIDKDVELLEESDDDLLYVEGDAIDDEVLIKAGIKRASALICALPMDTDNLFIVLSARQRRKELKIISRASQSSSYKKLKIAGADNVILPDSIGGQQMASLIVVPDLIDFMHNMTLSEGDMQNVKEIPYLSICPDGGTKKIKELAIREETGCSVIGYKKPNGEFLINPESELEMEEASNLIILGSAAQMKKLDQLYKTT
jgi:voltage-gated potassium channel